MIPIHVALVPYGYEVQTSTLLRVAAALQMQLTRDFTPIWGIPAVVSAFESLEQVPPGCLPLVIVEPGSLDSREHAFHRTVNRQPLGVVEGGEGWSLPASHELLELVCDPYGNQKVLGASIADEPGTERESWANRRKQGQVAYLVEICDPCQAIHYTVDGFEVSDFVTPQYYAPGETEGGRYSFTGKVTKPREVRRRGYLTWYTSDPEAPTWQAHRDARGRLKVGPLPGPASADSRHDVDYATDFVRGNPSASRPRTAGAKAERLARESARRYGAELERDLKELLDSYKPTVPLAKFLPELKKLAYDKTYYKSIRKDPNSLYDKLKGALPERFVFVGTEFPPQKTFRAAYDTLNRQHIRKAGLKIPRDAAITAMQGATIWKPPPKP